MVGLESLFFFKKKKQPMPPILSRHSVFESSSGFWTPQSIFFMSFRDEIPRIPKEARKITCCQKSPYIAFEIQDANVPWRLWYLYCTLQYPLTTSTKPPIGRCIWWTETFELEVKYSVVVVHESDYCPLFRSQLTTPQCILSF